ncbi:LysR family transcriptional regulator [Salmonella enterica subsp. enterica]|nr:LysR family transcriptional regulator [Salmonella enterica subsp. enterica]
MSVFISKQLKYFMVAMDKRCIAKAADVLCITRTPLSKILVDIETALGEKLFTRKYNHLEPTDLAKKLHCDLLPIYRAHLILESEIKKKCNHEMLNIIFDISCPEMIYKFASSAMKSINFDCHVTFERNVTSELMCNGDGLNKNHVIISLRDLSPINRYNYESWLGSEVAIMTSRNFNISTDALKIYTWKDKYTAFFAEKVISIIQSTFEINSEIEIIEHNHELPTLIYNVYHGNGCIVIPIKIATMYKSEKTAITPIKRSNVKVFMYHNLSKRMLMNYDEIKETLYTLI